MNDLVCASYVDIVQYDKVESLLDKGIFSSYEDLFEIREKGYAVLPHCCNMHCLRRVSPGDGTKSFWCHVPNILYLLPETTKNTFIPLTANLTVQCKQALSDIGLMKPSEMNHHGYKAEPVFYHKFFNPKRHVPPTNPTNDCNISPVIGTCLLY